MTEMTVRLSIAFVALSQSPDTLLQRIPGTDISIEMTRVPNGTFTMGSPDTEPGREADEGPQRAVSVDAFWIGIHELTDDQFSVFRYRRFDNDATGIEGERFDVDAITRPSPPYEDPAHGMGIQGDYPATGMTHWAAMQYARWLSLKTGRLYRLPTEAEWEYACRAGTATAYPFGETAEALGAHAWYEDSGGEAFHRVGEKAPNAWGVFDMMGNVAEWTMDQYDVAAYATWSTELTSAPWTTPTRWHPRVVRGGSFADDPAALRCASRFESTLRWKRRDPQLPKSQWWNTDSPHVGFRLVSPDRTFTLEEIRAYWDEVLESYSL